MPAVFDQTTVDIDAKQGNESLLVPRDRIGAEVRRLPQGLRRIERRQGRRRRRAEAQAARARSRTEADAQGTEAGAAFHRTSAALQRSVAGERARRARHWPSFHLRGDSDARSRSGSTSQKIGGKFAPTEIGLVVTDLLVENFRDIFDVAYTARLEEELDEIEEGKEKWTDALGRVLQEVPERSQICRKAYGEHQADGEAHRRKVRALWLAAGHQVGQARLVLRVQHLRQGKSGNLHVHQRKSDQPARSRFGRRAGDRRRKNIAKTAAGSWC